MNTTLQTGPISSVPALQEASQLAFAIVHASQKIRRNKAAFKRLSNDASAFVGNMIHFYRTMEEHFPRGVPEDLAFVFQRTVNLLNSIRGFIRDVASRNFFMALLCSRSDVKEIKTHDHALAMIKGTFKMLSNAHMQALVTKSSAETGNRG